MVYVDFIVKEQNYKLRLNARSLVSLEKKLGTHPINVFIALQSNQFPDTSKLIAILHASMQAFNANIKEENVYDIYDEYLAEGHSIVDIINLLMDVFKVSGLIPEDESEKQ